LNIQAWQTRNDNALTVDQQILNEQLHHLETNQQQLMETLSAISRHVLDEPTNSAVHRYATE
jgi:ABC-type sugar transport system ATPase subunit